MMPHSRGIINYSAMLPFLNALLTPTTILVNWEMPVGHWDQILFWGLTLGLTHLEPARALAQSWKQRGARQKASGAWQRSRVSRDGAWLPATVRWWQTSFGQVWLRTLAWVITCRKSKGRMQRARKEGATCMFWFGGGRRQRAQVRAGLQIKCGPQAGLANRWRGQAGVPRMGLQPHPCHWRGRKREKRWET